MSYYTRLLRQYNGLRNAEWMDGFPTIERVIKRYQKICESKGWTLEDRFRGISLQVKKEYESESKIVNACVYTLEQGLNRLSFFHKLYASIKPLLQEKSYTLSKETELEFLCFDNELIGDGFNLLINNTEVIIALKKGTVKLKLDKLIAKVEQDLEGIITFKKGF